jgi:5'-3' exonuclease
LNKRGDADLVLSNDYDCLTFGCKQLLVLTNAPQYVLFDLAHILIELKIDQSQFIDMCIASGTDYNKQGIPGLGLNKGLALALTKGSLTNWRSEQMPNYQAIRAIFLEDDEVQNPVTSDKNKELIKALAEVSLV